MLIKFLHWLRRLAARNPAARRAVVEELEPRILYSADANPLLWAAVEGSDTAVVGAVNAGQGASAPQAVDAPQQQERRREIVFVDAAVPDAQKLIDGVLASRPAGAVIEVIQLNSGTDGLKQIGDVLSAERGVDAVHIISHGGPGQLQLGNATIGAADLQDRAAELQGWRAALTAEADLMLYGCDVAADAGGRDFVQRLAQLTGADLAATSQP
jgi:hypothetical protein